MSDEKKQDAIRRLGGRLWRTADRFLWGNKAGALILGALIGLVAPAAAPVLAEPLNQFLDALTEDVA